MLKISNSIIESMNKNAHKQSALERLQSLRSAVEGQIVFTTSFGIEDQVITHIIADSGLNISFATLDTGRMFSQTYDLWADTQKFYGIKVQAFFPRAKAVEKFIVSQGVNGFYESLSSRKDCCDIRKLEPLGRALKNAAGWITGLRSDQSDHRKNFSFVSYDRTHDLIKLNPIFDWSRAETDDFVEANNVPIHELHAKGFPSIGCAPCTRAVAKGEPERAGRWWWEDEAKKECGLHLGFKQATNRTGDSA